jgi:hypothetical protein
MTNPIKTFYYFEVTAPNTGDIVGHLRSMLEQHISETDSKKSKVVKEFVFSNTKIHNKVDDTQAVTLEFMNSRHYDTYRTAVAPFREWLEEYDVTYSYEKISSTDISAARILVEDEDTTKLSYYDEMKVYMEETLPGARGFA